MSIRILDYIETVHEMGAGTVEDGKFCSIDDLYKQETYATASYVVPFGSRHANFTLFI